MTHTGPNRRGHRATDAEGHVVEARHTHEESLGSEAPSGKKRITNIWWDPDTNEIVAEIG